MESFPVDDFAIYVELAESEDTTNLFNGSETTNTSEEDVALIELTGGLMYIVYLCTCNIILGNSCP